MPEKITNESKKKYIRGGHWKNGKLILFEDCEIVVMRPWGKRAGAWMKTDSEWNGFRPEYPVLENDLLSNEWYKGKIPASFLKSRAEIDPEQPVQYTIPPGMDKQTSAWVKYYYRQLGRWCAYEQFLKQIPEWALCRARQLDSRQWHMLQLFNRVPGSKELFDSTPVLAFMLASCNAFHPIRHRFRASRRLKTRDGLHRFFGF